MILSQLVLVPYSDPWLVGLRLYPPELEAGDANGNTSRDSYTYFG